MSCPVCRADAAFIRKGDRPRYEALTPRVRVVDLFAGGGGLSLGFAEAARRMGHGVKIVAAVEQNPDAADVYGLNFPQAAVLRKDVAALFDGAPGEPPTTTEAELVAEIGAVDVLLAGPPCQGHSDLNNHTRRDDDRNGLYIRVARAAEILRPRAVLIENVPAVQRDRRGSVPGAMRVLENDYRVASAVLDLTLLGVPQRRRRHILLAVRDARVDPAALLATTIACGAHGARTVAWAIGDLAGATTARGPDAPSVPTVENHQRMLWLIKHPGQYDLPNELRPVCHHDEHSYVSMYGQLRWDAPAQTITTGYGSMGQGRYVHPSEARTVTPHEAARLQTLPDFFDLGAEKTRSTWAHVIGNAVPPLLGVHIGMPLLTALFPIKAGRRAAETTGGRTESSRSRRHAGVPEASSEMILQRMRSTKRRDTRPEVLLRSELHRQGLRYLVDHPVDGTRRRADIVFRGPRVVVYVDGCYWHSCPLHGTVPKTNREWWIDKLRTNRSRDADTDALLTRAGWRVLRFWEHDDPVEAAAKVIAAVRGRQPEDC